MKCYDQVCDKLSKLLMAICCVFMMAILCCSALQVISRYVLGSSITWTEEAARYSFIWLDMLGAAILVYKGGHAVVDLFSAKLHGTVKKVYDTIVYIAVLYTGGILARFGLQLSQMTFKQKSSSLKLPMGVVYGVIMICGAFVCFFVVNRMIHVWVDKPSEGEEK